VPDESIWVDDGTNSMAVWEGGGAGGNARLEIMLDKTVSMMGAGDYGLLLLQGNLDFYDRSCCSFFSAA
jgi:hypothetical protein